MSINAILFDVDGTLINSEPLSKLTICQMYQDYNLKLVLDDIVEFCGQSDELIFSTINTRYGIKADVSKQIQQREHLYNSQADEKLEKIEFAAEFVRKCRKAGLKIAVATGATKNHLSANLHALGLGFDDFDSITCESDVKHSKPAPDTYLVASEKLNKTPSECLVFEDSENGHKSARNAGCISIGILSTFSKENQISCGASAVMKDFCEFPDFNSVQSFNSALEEFLKQKNCK